MKKIPYVMNYKLLIFPLMYLLFQSCTEIVEFPNLPIPDQPVMYAYLNPDSNIQALVYRSMSMPESLESSVLENVDLRLFENEKELNVAFVFENGKYTADYKPLADKTYALHAKHPEFGEFWTEDRIPENVKVTDIAFDIGIKYLPRSDIMLSRATFVLHDDPAEENYYEFFAYDTTMSWFEDYPEADTLGSRNNMINYTSESPLFRDENLLQYEQFESLILSDAAFNGKQQQLSFDFQGASMYCASTRCQTYLVVRTISKASYEYKKSLMIHKNSRGLQQISDVSEIAEYGFAFAPAQVSSNVENGLGNTISHSEKSYLLLELRNSFK